MTRCTERAYRNAGRLRRLLAGARPLSLYALLVVVEVVAVLVALVALLALLGRGD
jgi:hypothetical protein